ncbi:hypothetical protein [Flavilitoribacter nigricans]|uniref:Cytochrome c domain-containing protein n=1 Tax=Flavilitoribacter nigricans (strain ATCC 23147 / DSM 23189 / NBRC 102662 / NCIMB 1420 / SS-2) TaxID=1122177 RepID=A0A2D0MZQ1_FLAN2|nr:hypothetical protein [Flavilitoribacter nigricans]PHN01608.1 hypothetical protein CRP01_36525 [Flavilitoribacter nigricans DSM 23189 = NBRC 102662]
MVYKPTRILIKKNGVWVTGNYLWNAAQTDADLMENTFNPAISFIDENDNTVNISYVVPAKPDCFTCHQNRSQVTPIGPKLRNMNLVANGHNQLQSLINRQWLTGIVHPAEIPALPNSKDPNVSLELRARAYLEVNCAHCHTDDGFCAGPFNPSLRLSYATPFADTQLDDYGSSINYVMDPQRFEEVGFKMPMIGTTVPDDAGINLVKAYIESLD